MMPDDLKTAVDRAESLLLDRAQVQRALADTEAALPTAIAARAESESGLADAETRLAMGECKPEVAAAALKALQTARGKLDALLARRAGLGARADKQAGELAAAVEQIRTLMPDHVAAVQADFLDTIWLPARDAFSAVLARRAALESALSARLDLPEATAASSAPIDTGEAGRPGVVLAELTAALQWTEGRKRNTDRASKRRGSFAADGLYTLLKTCAGYPAGSLIIGHMLGTEGTYFFEHNFLRPIGAHEWNEMTTGAAQTAG